MSLTHKPSNNWLERRLNKYTTEEKYYKEIFHQIMAKMSEFPSPAVLGLPKLERRWRGLLGQQSAFVDKQAVAGGRRRQERQEKAHFKNLRVSVKEKKGAEGDG